jgi:hypothetical protein
MFRTDSMMLSTNKISIILFDYKKRFLTAVLIFCYAYLHVKLTGVYGGSPLDDLIHFEVRFPFAQRVLMPILGRILIQIIHCKAQEAFFILEILASSLLFWVLNDLLRKFLPPKPALAFTWLFFLLLPLLTVINYRFTLQGTANIFYPWDTPSLLFMFAGLYCCLEKKWPSYFLLIFLATANRESSLLLVLLIPAIYWRECRHYWLVFLSALLIYCLTRACILSALSSHSGFIFELNYNKTSIPLLHLNLRWLLYELQFLLLFYAFMGATLFWLVFYEYIPKQLRSLKYIALLYFLSLLQVGIISETRILGEIIGLLYLPICLGIFNWLSDLGPYPSSQNWASTVDRYFITLAIICYLLLFYLRLI